MNAESKRTYKAILKLAFPLMLQNLLSALVSSADILMLNSVGQSAISAVSLATQYSSIIMFVFNGLSTGVTMLGAQYWGKKDAHAIELVQGIALRFVVIITGCALVCTLLIPETMMVLFTKDPELISLGASYLRMVGASYIFWGITECYLASLRSIGRVVVSTALNTTALGLNIVLNAIFIYGLLGAPAMGAPGAALATTISRGITLVISLIVSRKSKDIKFRLGNIFVKNAVLFRDFMHMALPSLFNDVAWSIAFSVYTAIFGHLGTDVVAANSIVVVVRNFATVACFGLAGSAIIWLGNLLGEGRLKEAEKDASRYMKITIIAGAIGGAAIILLMPLIMDFADISAVSKEYMRYMLLINGYYVVGQAVNTLMICGIFRAGGNSRFGMICDIIDMWCYGVPLGLLAAFVFKLPPIWVYFLLCTDEFVKWPWVFGYYKKKKWIRNITKDYE